jgi:hypothetical protein
VRRDQIVDNGPASFRPSERANFVVLHQPAVTGNIGSEDRSKFALDRVMALGTSPTEYSETPNKRATFRVPLVPAVHQNRRLRLAHCFGPLVTVCFLITPGQREPVFMPRSRPSRSLLKQKVLVVKLHYGENEPRADPEQ